MAAFGFADGGRLSLAELLAQGFDVAGTDAGDQLTGTNTTDRIRGPAGNDTLAGGAGDDTADYGTATAGVNLGLATWQYTYGSGYDTLVSIENLVGRTSTTSWSATGPATCWRAA